MSTPSPPAKVSAVRWPSFDNEQIAAVARVLRSGRINYWTGEEGKSFETEYAEYLGVARAIAVANGTVALELALHALQIGVGDEVIVPSRTFIATASAVVARGGRPIVVDIDRFSNNVTAESIQAACTPKTRAIIVVHVGGWPCDMHSILEVANLHGVPVIEDCAQAHGAFYRGRPVGTFGAISAFSFCQDKIITTGGEGGLVATNDAVLWERAWSFKDHGKDYARAHDKSHSSGFRYLHETFGTNMRMTEMQAAIGRIQLRKLPEFHRTRTDNALTLSRHLEGCPGLIFPQPNDDCVHAYYRLYALVEPTLLMHGWTRDRLLAELCAENVPVGTGSCGEIYREKAFDAFGPRSRLPNARYAQDNSLAFLVDPSFDEDDMIRVAGRVRKLFEAIATKHRQSLNSAA